MLEIWEYPAHVETLWLQFLTSLSNTWKDSNKYQHKYESMQNSIWHAIADVDTVHMLLTWKPCDCIKNSHFFWGNACLKGQCCWTDEVCFCLKSFPCVLCLTYVYMLIFIVKGQNASLGGLAIHVLFFLILSGLTFPSITNERGHGNYSLSSFSCPSVRGDTKFWPVTQSMIARIIKRVHSGPKKTQMFSSSPFP